MAAAAYREPMSVAAKSPVSAAPQPHSPWHSPVPYLFGGLAAMLGLIAFALLILACSYWKLSGYLEGEGEAERDLEAGEGKVNETQKASAAYEEKILVIMAGQEKPTFLATPMWSSRSPSFGDNCSTCTCDKTDKSVETEETVKQGSGHLQLQSRNRDTQDNSDQNH